MPEDKTPQAHTELRRSDKDRPQEDATTADDATEQPPGLKPRTPQDKLPGDEDEELFNDVPL